MAEAPEDQFSDDLDYEVDYRSDFHDFYDLMKFRVSRILLVSSLYDAFTLEEDGLIFEQISTEYRDLALPFPPQVVRVSTGKRAIKELTEGNYDMVITMARLVDMDPVEFGRRIKRINPDIPIILLLTDAGDIQLFHTPGEHDCIDKIFFWHGDSALFLVGYYAVGDHLSSGSDSTNIAEEYRDELLNWIMGRLEALQYRYEAAAFYLSAYEKARQEVGFKK